MRRITFNFFYPVALCVPFLAATIVHGVEDDELPSSSPQNELYRDGQGSVVRLSEERLVPFKKSGTSPRLSSKFAHYRSSIARFPMVRDCLIEAERLNPEPDLAAIDWDQIDNDEQAEVCLFRVASSYGDAGAMEAWFKAQGLRLHTRADGSFLRVPIYGVAGGRLIDEQGALYSSGWLNDLIIRIFAHAVTLSVSYTEDNQVYDTDAGYTYH